MQMAVRIGRAVMQEPLEASRWRRYRSSFSHRASVSGSRTGRLARMEKSVFGRKTVSRKSFLVASAVIGSAFQCWPWSAYAGFLACLREFREKRQGAQPRLSAGAGPKLKTQARSGLNGQARAKTRANTLQGLVSPIRSIRLTMRHDLPKAHEFSP